MGRSFYGRGFLGDLKFKMQGEARDLVHTVAQHCHGKS